MPRVTFFESLRRSLAVAVLCASVALAAWAGEGPTNERAAPAAGPDALAPRLTPTADRLYLTWLEPVPEAEGSHRLRVSHRATNGSWSEPVTIREGSDFFANWADVPGLAEAPDGPLVAWWLQKLSEGTYAYGVHLARSSDGGGTWEDAGWLHDDTSATEHGFVSMVPGAEALWAFWLDGRAMTMEGGGHGHDASGAMSLRSAVLRDGRPAPSVLLDDRTCECCDTGATVTPSGPVVVYRNRSETEIRDVGLVRAGATPSAPTLVHEDGWEIAGCPVNGPSVSAPEGSVGVAWFTAADDRSRVQVAFSRDGARSFGAPIVLDDARPVGRVDTAPAPEGRLWVSWLARADEGGELRLAAVAPDGIVGEPRMVARTSAERSAGVPSLAVFDGAPWLAWIEEPFGEPARLRVERLEP